MHVSRQAASPARCLTALGLILSMAASLFPTGAFAAPDGAGGSLLPPAEITGNVVMADGLTAVPGVNVMASNSETRQIYASGVTREDGTYTLKGLPAGSYELRIGMPEGIYATEGAITAASGTRTIVSLSLGPRAQEEDDGEEGDEGEETEEPAEEPAEGEEPPAEEGETPPEPEEKEKDEGGGFVDFMKSPVGAITAIVISALIIGAIANSAADDEEGDDEPPMTTIGSSAPPP